tara:strand:- start:584 stop:874 length:291 start_codon:yes stop_codon:yes gene_type:complete
MNSLGVFLLFFLVIYITIVYANKKFNVDKEFVIVKEKALPTSFYDYFKQPSLVSNYSVMFGLTGDELNLINSQVDIDNEKNMDKKVFVPQRVFVNI